MLNDSRVMLTSLSANGILVLTAFSGKQFLLSFDQSNLKESTIASAIIALVCSLNLRSHAQIGHV